MESHEKDLNLIRVVREGSSLEEAERLLSEGAQINGRDDYGNTPLHEAAISRKEEMAKLLIRSGADIDAKGKYGKHPLHCAVTWHSGEVADIEQRDVLRKSLAKVFFEEGADVNARNNNGETPLHTAVPAKGYRMLEAVLLLIATGADVNAADKDGQTPLHLAASRFSHPDLVRLLVNSGADVNATCVNRGVHPKATIATRTPLHIAANSGECGWSENTNLARR